MARAVLRARRVIPVQLLLEVGAERLAGEGKCAARAIPIVPHHRRRRGSSRRSKNQATETKSSRAEKAARASAGPKPPLPFHCPFR